VRPVFTVIDGTRILTGASGQAWSNAGHAKSTLADQDLPGLPSPVFLAPQVARLLGRGALLLGALPAQSQPARMTGG